MGKRTKTTIIRENPDDEMEEQGKLVAREIEDDAGEQSFSDFMAKNKGLDGCRVKIRRQTPQGREYCGSFLPEEIENAEEFLRLYHSKQDFANESSTYYVSVEVNGETRSVFPIRIAAQVKSIAGLQATSGGMADYGLREQIARLEARLAQQEKTPMLEMVDGLAKLDQLRGGQNNGFSLDNALKCIEIGTRMNGGGGDSGGWEGLVRDVLKDNAPAIIGLLQLGVRKLGEVTAKPAAAATVPAQEPLHPPQMEVVNPNMEGSEQELAMLREQIQFLKRKAAQHSDPGLYVDLICDNREDPLYERLIHQITHTEFSEFAAKVDPEINEPAYKDFFNFIHDRIGRVFARPNPVAADTGRKRGNKSHTEGNGTTGKSGG